MSVVGGGATATVEEGATVAAEEADMGGAVRGCAMSFF
jgi:hypothetical protein